MAPRTRPGDREGRRAADGHRGRAGGRTLWRLGVLAALLVTVAIVVARKPAREAPSGVGPAVGIAATPADATRASGVPRLVDVGAERCIPCKAMAPILQELRVEYAGRMQVDFIDVWKNPAAGDPYGVHMIPTQIFFDGEGRELARHQGFISKADILATWKRVGYDFTSPPQATRGS